MDLYLLMIILDRNNLTPPDQLFRGKSYFVTPVFRSALPRVLTHRFMIDCKAVDADILTFPWFDADSAEGLRRGRGGMTRAERERVGLAGLRRKSQSVSKRGETGVMCWMVGRAGLRWGGLWTVLWQGCQQIEYMWIRREVKEGVFGWVRENQIKSNQFISNQS